jgi:hypothetical protein
MLTELYIEALLADDALAVEVWALWDAGVITDDMAAWAWRILMRFGKGRHMRKCAEANRSYLECSYPAHLDALCMKTDRLRNDKELVAIAKRLRNQPIEVIDRYGHLDELLRAIQLERERLADRPFLVVLLQYEFNIDGGYDWVYLLESFDSQAQAVLYVVAAL